MRFEAVQGFANIRRDEVGPALAAGLFFFCVLTALMVVRPAREALGMQRGIEALRWLFLGTVLVTLLVNPIFGWLVSRFRRIAFVGVTYLFFAFGLLGFYALLAFAPAELLPGARLVRAFNAIGAARMGSAYREPGRVGMPIAGDDAEAIAIASRLIRDVGYEPVLIGGLAMGKYLMPGTPLSGERTADEIRKIAATLN